MKLFQGEVLVYKQLRQYLSNMEDTAALLNIILLTMELSDSLTRFKNLYIAFLIISPHEPTSEYVNINLA